MLRKFFVATSISVLAIGGSTACATKKFVRTSVGEVNDKVDSLGRSVEETQERTRRNEGRISEVDQRAGAAQQSADQAGQAASAAHSAANAVGTKFDEFDKSNRRLVYEMVLSEDSGNFKFGKTNLPDEAKSKIDEVVSKLKTDPKNIWIEIEGHTDSIGNKMVNDKIGLERAQAVEKYLYEQYQIPLHKMNVISYGAEKPVAPNKTREGRAQNRRVVIKILA
jgi:outer membrane protein OmpA-like peptidoglycan-associated protein